MSICLAVARVRGAVLGLSVLTLWLAALPLAQAQNNTTNRAVGGVSINASGVMSVASADATRELRVARSETLQKIPGDLQQKSGLRKVSLRALEEAIVAQIEDGLPLPDAMKYLAGLQQIQYVFVYPEQQDIVLAGTGEGWKIDAQGNVVGMTTGRPVLLLDDLLVALRTARQAAQGGITCSIDPTAEGLNRLRSYVAKLSNIGNPRTTIQGIETTLGPQVISVTGVPATTHFARVLVAADYRMKRLAMDFEPAPIRGLPSYLSMVPAKGHGMNNMLPRWWLTADYQPLLRDSDGLSWQLPGASVKAMTEEDFLAADGTRQQTGKANPLAQRWADTMTARYDELAAVDPIFAELRNCMDLAMVGALIVKENLAKKSGCNMRVLLNSDRVAIDQYVAPERVQSKASLIRKGNNWVISASGGVRISAWEAAGKSQPNDAAAAARPKSTSAAQSWWWN